LRVAIGQRVSSRDKRLLAVRARAVAAAVVAIKAQRRARGGAGRSALPSSVARLVSLCVGASSLVYSSSVKSESLAAMVGAVKVTRPAGRRVVVTGGRSGRGGVHPLARVWSEATTARGQAVAVARAARSELLRARASRLADFDAGTRLLRSGNLARNEGKTAAAARRKLARLAARGVV
jgi:glutamate 5-kinase